MANHDTTSNQQSKTEGKEKLAVFFSKREIVIPGQLLADGRYRSSLGTYQKEEKVYSAVVGLAELRGNTVKVVPLQGVYIPREGDLVIGTITIVAGNNWKIDIGGPYQASLHANNAFMNRTTVTDSNASGIDPRLACFAILAAWIVSRL